MWMQKLRSHLLKIQSYQRFSLLTSPFVIPPVTKWSILKSHCPSVCLFICPALSRRYLLNWSTFCNQRSYGGASSWGQVSCKRIGLLVFPQWGTEDAEIKVLSVCAHKCSPFKAWSRSDHSHTCSAHYLKFLPCTNIYCPGSFTFIFSFPYFFYCVSFN